MQIANSIQQAQQALILYLCLVHFLETLQGASAVNDCKCVFVMISPKTRNRTPSPVIDCVGLQMSKHSWNCLDFLALTHLSGASTSLTRQTQQ